MFRAREERPQAPPAGGVLYREGGPIVAAAAVLFVIAAAALFAVAFPERVLLQRLLQCVELPGPEEGPRPGEEAVDIARHSSGSDMHDGFCQQRLEGLNRPPVGHVHFFDVVAAFRRESDPTIGCSYMYYRWFNPLGFQPDSVRDVPCRLRPDLVVWHGSE